MTAKWKESAGVYCEWWWLLCKRYCRLRGWRWRQTNFFFTCKTHLFTFSSGRQIFFSNVCSCVHTHNVRTHALSSEACYTLFANNDETRTKWRNKDVQQIVYGSCSPCFVNRFFAARCLQDLRRGNGLFDKQKGVFSQKKEISSGEYVCTKIDGEQQTVYSSTFSLFSQTIFCSAKKWFCSLFVMFAPIV